MKKIKVEHNFKKYLLWAIIIGVCISFAGLSYAWFSSNVFGSSNDQIVETGTLELVFTDGPEIIKENIHPGTIITKEFTVENTGTLDTSFSVNLKDLINQIENEELVWRLKYNETLLNGIVPTEGEVLVESIPISSQEKIEFTLEIEFIETNSNQNYNQNKNFSAVLQIKDNSSNGVQLSLNLNGVETDKLPEDGNYILKKYSCSNNAPLYYDRSLNKIIIHSDTTNGNCTLNFVDLEKATVKEAVLSDNIAYSDNVKSPYVSNDDGINFAAVSSDINGQGLYYTDDINETDEDGDGVGSKIYYFRGKVENNYLVFANFCWRIVRTNENGSVKLRYAGVPTISNNTYTCPKTGTAVNIASSKFHSTDTLNKYFGYTFGNEKNEQGTELYGNNDSVVKTVIDTWYENNFEKQGKDITDKIADTIYCADRTNPTPGAHNGIYYGARVRLTDISYSNSSWAPKSKIQPIYKCLDVINDGYTLNVENGGTSGYGNNLLKYPIALLTADEVSFAGGRYTEYDVNSSPNTSYFMHMNQLYWLISPSTMYDNTSDTFNVYTVGSIHSFNTVAYSYAVVPAISLKDTVNISGGTGLYNDPYVVK